MSEIKFRYRLRNKVSGKILTEIFDIKKLELGALEYYVEHASYEILSRDQFIGRKDKNGVEIYGEDIVKSDTLHGVRNGVIKFGEYTFEDMGDWHNKHDHTCYGWYIEYQNPDEIDEKINDVEVVGNTYETDD